MCLDGQSNVLKDGHIDGGLNLESEKLAKKWWKKPHLQYILPSIIPFYSLFMTRYS